MPEMGSLGIRLMRHQSDSFHLYRPQTKLREGNVFTPVCRSFCSQGRYPQADTHLGRHPPVQCMLGYGQQAGSTHPTGMHSCYHQQTKFLHVSVSHSVHRGCGIPACIAVSRPTTRGEVEGLAWGGVSRPTPKGSTGPHLRGSPGQTPHPSRWLLLLAVCILLECILVTVLFTQTLSMKQ